VRLRLSRKLCLLSLGVLFCGVGAVGATKWWRERPLAGARKAFEQGDWAGVLTQAGSVLAQGQCREESKLLIARSLSRLGRDVEAESLFQQIPISELSADDLTYLGQRFTALRRWSRAVDVYSELCRRHPDDSELLKRHVVSLFQTGNLQPSLDAAQKLAQHPDQAAGSYCIQGVIYEVMGKYDDAAQCLTKVVELDPDGASLPVPMSQIIDKLVNSLATIGRLDEAEQHMRRQIAKQPTANLLARLGELLVTKGDHEGAWQNWIETLRLDKRHPDAMLGLGRLALSRRQPAEAVGWLKLAEVRGASNPRREYMLSVAYRQLGRIDLSEAHARENKRLTEEESRAEKEARLVLDQPGAGQALLLRAQRALEAGQVLEAEGCLVELERQFPHDPKVRSLAAQIRARTGL